MKNIPEAISKASAHDTILIKKGVYRNGSIEIAKPLTLRGTEGTVIDGSFKGHVIHIKSKHVTLDSLTIRNSGKSDIEDIAGIYVENTSHCRLMNNHILNTTYGIYLARAKNCELEGNIMKGNAKGEVLSGNGIHLWYSHFIQIRKNHISNHRDGLYFEFSYSLSISDNQSSQNLRYGMHFMFCHDSDFIRNSFSANQTGVAIMYSERINVFRNYFDKSFKSFSLGLLLKEINYSNFRYNIIQNKTEGMILDSVSYTIFQFNHLKKNGIAIKIYGNCDQNIFSENNITDNFFDVSTNTKENRNKFTRNYWSKYKGFDLDLDGHGDILYRPVHSFVYWTEKIPELALLLNSPISYFLEFAERIFPALGPEHLYDETPLIFPVTIPPP